jgi:predicted dienelactone hydrolase
MNHWPLLLIAAIFLPIGRQAIAQSSSNPAEKTSPIVGMATRDFIDTGRKNWRGTGQRTIRTIIWYPAANAAASADELIQAPPISSQSPTYPLILISHGAGGSASGMNWLGHYLASRGYIAAAVNHIGTPEDEIQLAGRFYLSEWNIWERPKDLSVALDKLLADPVFGPRIDHGRIGAAGFSLGGYTVIAVAGGILDLKRLEANSPPPPPEIGEALPKAIAESKELQKTNSVVRESLRHSGDSYKDRRFMGVFALAPAIGGGFTQAGLASVTIPVRIVVGRDDVVTPLPADAQRYADLIHGARLTVLPGEAGHFVQDHDAAHQTSVLEQVSGLAFAFFEQVFAKP